MGTTSVLVVEQDPIRREGLLACLSRHSDLRVVGAGPNLPAALDSALSPNQIDILLINVDQPETIQARFWATLHLLLPTMIRVEALSRGASESQLEILLGAGVVSLYPPDTDPETICQAVKNASQGRMDYHPLLAERLKLLLMQPPKERAVRIGELTLDQQTGQLLRGLEPVKVTDREWEVLPLLGERMTNREIARRLGIGERTVAFHVSNILRKLGVLSRVEAGLVAQWLQNLPDAGTGRQDL